MPVPTNLNIDDALLRRAQRLGAHRTKRQTVETALRRYIRYLGQKKALALAGTIDYDPTYDYKAQRRRA